MSDFLSRYLSELGSLVNFHIKFYTCSSTTLIFKKFTDFLFDVALLLYCTLPQMDILHLINDICVCACVSVLYCGDRHDSGPHGGLRDGLRG